MHTTKGKGCGPTLTEMSERRNHRNIAAVTRKGQDLVDFGVAPERDETTKEAILTTNQPMGQNSIRSKSEIMISKCLKIE